MIEIQSMQELGSWLHESQEDHLVMLTQPSWCIPCRRLRPHVEKLNEAGLSVLYVDLDLVPAAAEFYAVRSVPHLYFYPEKSQEYFELDGRTVVQIQKEIEGIRNAG